MTDDQLRMQAARGVLDRVVMEFAAKGMKVDDIATMLFDRAVRQALTLPQETIAALVVMITDALALGVREHTMSVDRNLN
jgi:hypothetical protein